MDIRKVASPNVQIASQSHESRKLNLVASEKSNDFSYAIKKCDRCGSFYTSNTNVCYNCQPKDNLEIAKLNTYIEKYGTNHSLDDYSVSTGISLKNLNRYISDGAIDIPL